MAYRYGDRYQLAMFPESIDKYVGANDPVRAYDVFIDSLDLADLEVEYITNKVGNSNYDPRLMLKLLVYGCSYGWHSSRKIERAVNHNVSFMWLMGGLKPDHKTIAEFRRNNKRALKKIIKLCAKLCIELDLIEGNVLFLDSTKIRANAARSKNHTKKYYQEQLKDIDNRIEALLNKCDEVDETEKELDSFIKMHDELSHAESLKSKVQAALKKFEDRGEKTKNGASRTVNQTDPECALMRSIQGSHASYNVQSVVDNQHGLIVNTDVVSDASDVNQFANQITQAEDVTGKECEIGCSDAGYAHTDEIHKIDKRERTTAIVPSQRQALHKEEKPFSKSVFMYDEETNTYECPEGYTLQYIRKKDKNKLEYRIINPELCRQCKNWQVCTKSKHGRRINRFVNEHIKEHLERQYEEESNQAIYALRKTKVEHPFGHIKHNLGKTRFFMRGREGANAEASVSATCFNIARMITIFGGVSEFIERLGAFKG